MIDYKNELNPAQYEAATTLKGPVLVIAGAGSGKTRTIVYRLANLIESGVPASSILLLTFTRKASHEMLDRARHLLGQRGMGGVDLAGLAGVQGGTFHSFAYSVLRVFRPEGYEREATVMDSSDALAILQHCKEELQAGKGDRSFPRNQTVMALLSKSRNREQPLEDILRHDSVHLLPHLDAIQDIGMTYERMKRERGLLDYDDLLFELEKMLRGRAEVLDYCRRRHQYLMVDEFQDTNLVQARITALIAGAERGPEEARAGSGNILAVGDDAQSIYAFRGANVRNILDFPKIYEGTRLIRLEENYRSTQPLLDLSNCILDHASEGFKKRLFTHKPGSGLPQVLRPMSDLSQGGLAAAKIVELLGDYPASEIAVLFRAGYQSYHVEVQLNKLGVRFKKYGGIRYTDAAHIKDAMSFVRLLLNPLDFPAFRRLTDFVKGVGAKTSLKLHMALQMGNVKEIEKACKRHPDLAAHLEFLNKMRELNLTPRLLMEQVTDYYQPIMEGLFPDDYPKRRQGLDELVQISAAYTDLDLFVADLSLDDPFSQEDDRDCITLSTIHSAKGLEWGAVLILDLVEERFPSRHALSREEDFEEERRLMYVACTRAKDYLGLFVPATLYDRGSGGNIPAVPSPFVRELAGTMYEEWQESYTGGWVRRSGNSSGRGDAAAFLKRPAPGSFSENSGTFLLGGAGAFGGDTPAGASFQVHKKRKSSSGLDEGSEPFLASESTMNLKELKESARHSRLEPEPEPLARPQLNGLKPEECGYCNHKIFGRGKVVKFMPPDKYQVNFPGMGLKTIMGAFLTFEEV